LEKFLLKKLRKCDPKELILWISSCQTPPINKERMAVIEYALAVLLSLDYRKRFGTRKVSRELVKSVIANAIKDFDEIRFGRSGVENPELQAFFRLGFLMIRGEAFAWQFAEASMERYGKHNEWMLNNLGFTIFDAVHFSKEIMKVLSLRTIDWNMPPLPSFTEAQYYDPQFVYVPSQEIKNVWKSKFLFSEREILSLVKKDESQKLQAYLRRLSSSVGETRYEISNPSDFNLLYEKPFVKIGNEFILPIPSILWRALSTTFHYDFLHDETYVEKYIDEKGKAAERRVIACFKKYFPSEKLFPRVKYSKKTGEPDVDLIVDADSLALVIECSSKWMTISAKSGNLDAIVGDLRSSLTKCHNQLDRAMQACQRGEIANLKDKKLLPVIVVDDYIPHLDLILQFFDFPEKNRPYIINIYDLDIITDIAKKEDFIEFISKRTGLSEKKRIFAVDEVDYFIHYKKYGLEKVADLMEKGDSSLLYIAHMEELYPDYYREHLLKFVDDESFARRLLLSNTRLEAGWS
jgi:hypothetical protein